MFRFSYKPPSPVNSASVLKGRLQLSDVIFLDQEWRAVSYDALVFVNNSETFN